MDEFYTAIYEKQGPLAHIPDGLGGIDQLVEAIGAAELAANLRLPPSATVDQVAARIIEADNQTILNWGSDVYTLIEAIGPQLARAFGWEEQEFTPDDIRSGILELRRRARATRLGLAAGTLSLHDLANIDTEQQDIAFLRGHNLPLDTPREAITDMRVNLTMGLPVRATAEDRAAARIVMDATAITLSASRPEPQGPGVSAEELEKLIYPPYDK